MQLPELRKTMLAVVMFLVHIGAAYSGAIANLDSKELNTNVNNGLANDTMVAEESSIAQRDPIKAEIKLHGNPTLKLKRDSKSDSKDLTNSFHLVTFSNTHPTTNLKFEGNTKQEQMNSFSDSNWMKNLLKPSSSVKQLPKNFVDKPNFLNFWKETKENIQPVFNSGKGGISKFVIPRERNNIPLGIAANNVVANSNTHHSTPSKLKRPENYVNNSHYGNFVNQHLLKVFREGHPTLRQEDHRGDSPEVGSGVQAFHFQNIGGIEHPAYSPVFDHTIPIELLNHFQPDHHFNFNEAEFNDHSGSGESSFKTSNELTGFRQSDFQTVHSLGGNPSHESIHFKTPDHEPAHDLENFSHFNLNHASTPKGFRHSANKNVPGVISLDNFNSISNHGDLGHKLYLNAGESFHENNEQIFDTRFTHGSTGNFGDKGYKLDIFPIRSSESHSRPIGPDSTGFSYSKRKILRNLPTIGDSNLRPANHDSSSLIKFNLTPSNGPLIASDSDYISNHDSDDTNSQHIRVFEGSHRNSAHQEIQSFRRPNANKKHILKFIDVPNPIEATRIKGFSDENKNTGNHYFSSFNDHEINYDPDLFRSTDDHLKSSFKNADIFHKIEVIPFRLEDRMTEKMIQKARLNAKDKEVTNSSPFKAAEGARGALETGNYKHHHNTNEDNSHLSYTKRLSSNKRNQMHGLDSADLSINQQLHEYDDIQTVRLNDGKPFLRKNKEYTIANIGSDIISNKGTNDDIEIMEERPIRDSPELFVEGIQPFKKLSSPHHERGTQYYRSNFPLSTFKEQPLEKINYENLDHNIAKLDGAVTKSSQKSIEPICYSLPESYISFPPYEKSKSICF